MEEQIDNISTLKRSFALHKENQFLNLMLYFQYFWILPSVQETMSGVTENTQRITRLLQG